MGIQEIVVFALVVIAALYTGRKFIRQFTRGEDAKEGCAKCELNKIMTSKSNN